jgi:glycosyltransferase involved in cell wall biosynthesis
MVYPSLFGPENLPPLESFALGCPVVASDIPGAAEQLGSCAVRVDPFDAEGWSRAILEVFSDETLRRRLVESGRTRAVGFTAREFAKSLCGLFSDVARLVRRWR